MNRLVIQWPRLGPYHLARLRVAHGYLAERGVELIALETASDDDVYEWDVEREDEPFRRVQVFPGRTFESIGPAEMHEGVTRALDAIAPDVVAIHTYSFPDSRACVTWCRSTRRGAVVMTDSKADDAVRSRVREAVKGRLLGCYDAAVTAGSASREYLMQLGVPRERIWLGYDVVDNDYFARTAAAAVGSAPGVPDGPPFFLASNRFIERKNLFTLLDAYAAYRQTVEHPWRLVMLGDGPLRSELEAAAGEGVLFVGFRQIEEIPHFYARAAALVHTARVDQWALVVNEAMACGLPVIVSTGAGAHRDLVHPGENGYVFAPDDRGRLTSCLETMTLDGNLERMGQRSRDIIADWSLLRFAASMHSAAMCAAPVGNRRFGLLDRGLLAAMRFATRSTTSFHSIES